MLAEQAAAAGVTINLQQVDPGTFFATGKYLNWTFSQDYYSYTPYLNQVSQSFLGPSSPFNETHLNNRTTPPVQHGQRHGRSGEA